MPKLTPLPEGFKVTKCPPTTAPENRYKAAATFEGRQIRPKSNYRLLKEEEHAIENGFDSRVEMVKSTHTDAERRAEQFQEAFHAARAGGASVSDALDAANQVAYGKKVG